ncbi:MAG: LLM class F420-dependent oxidoreductase, partial [Actinophytocola sp.]|nr:LLM class F420-dependent oxidoreductase [Actinophytocola sp.]
MSIDLGSFGIWQRADRVSVDLAAAVERLGYGAVWLGGSPAGDLVDVERLLAGTSRLAVATGIVNIWTDDAASV